ncbi:MAG: 3-isopropylmalate dehydratase [Candidatus Aminicenantaceae bacterium]
MSRQAVLEGRIWVLTDRDGRLIEDIDTDQIFHNAHLHITEMAEMGPYALGNLEGWKQFAGEAREGDLIFAGRNFGAGSSRQQAVDCFIALGSRLIAAPSFGAIYFRNAVNSGLPVLGGLNLAGLVEEGALQTGDSVHIDLLSGEGHSLTQGSDFTLSPMSGVQHDIWLAGDLFAYAREGAGG